MYTNILSKNKILYTKLSRRNFLFFLALLPFINSFKHTNFDLNNKLKHIINHNGVIALAKIGTGELIGCSNLNLALQPHTIGSLAKVITAISLLENNLITSNDKYYCKGYEIIDGKKIYCWNQNGHGNLNIESAISESCNLFFNNYSSRISNQDILKYYEILKLNTKELVEKDTLTNNRPLPKAASKYEIALGLHPYLCFNTIQLLSLSCTIARNGIYKPITLNNSSSKGINLSLKESTISIIQNGMIRSATDGTGKLLNKNNISAAIKTGTAPNKDNTYHGWCMGYTPINKPSIAFCIFINNGTGYSNALPIANEVLKTCINM